MTTFSNNVALGVMMGVLGIRTTPVRSDDTSLAKIQCYLTIE